MKTVGNELKVGGDSGQEGKLSVGSQLLVIAAVVVLGSVVIGGARLTQPDAGTSQGAAQSEDDASPAPGTFEYFPAQYVNQGKEIEEHIQAF